MAAPRPLRPARTMEVYITLCICGRESENPASVVDSAGSVACPCGRVALVESRKARQQ